MRFRRMSSQFVLMLVVLGLIWAAAPGRVAAEEGSFWYAIDNVTKIEKDARFLLWIALPAEWHGQEVKVTAIEPDPVGVFKDPASGNKIIEWLWEPEPWEMLPEMSPEHFFFHYDFTVEEKPLKFAFDPAKITDYDRDSAEYKAYTAAATYLQIDGPVRDQALSVVGAEKNPGLQAKLLYDWVLSNMTFVPGGEGDRDAISTLASRRGDCGQFSAVYTAMCRSLGIPARNISLVWFDSGLHDMNEIILPGYGWFPVDTSLGQMLMPGGGGLAEEEVASFMGAHGVPLGDPAVAFGNMPDGRMVMTQGVNVRFDSKTLDRQVVLQQMRPGGAQAHPAGFEEDGFNRDFVHGGFFVFGDQVLDDESVHALTHQRLANLFFEEGLYDVVEDGCRQSLERYAGAMASWVNMGKVYMHKGEYYKAEAAFKRAQIEVTTNRMEKAEAMIWTHNYLGNCYDLLGHRELAEGEYQKVVDRGDNYRGAVEYAKKYLKKPFAKKVH